MGKNLEVISRGLIKVLSIHLPARTEENQEKRQPGSRWFRQIFELGIVL
jgi:hypothetical protein